MIESKRRRRVIANIATYLVLATLSMFCIGPMIWMFLTSLKYEADIVTQTMVTVQVGDQSIIARLPPRFAGRRNEPIFLAVDPASANLFDPGSEQRIDI